MWDVKWVSLQALPVWCLAAGAVASGQAPPRPGQLPTLPLTQLDDRTLAADLDNRAFTLTFPQPVAIRDLLLLLVRGTSLSVVPGPEVTGTFIGELKNVTVRQALDLILPPLGLDYSIDGSFIRVFRRQPETRLFDIDYGAILRTGTSAVGPAGDGGSFARVTGTIGTDVFAELTKGVQTLLSETATFSVDRKAGLLQVTDFPERLERVAQYVDAVHDRVHRQVQIDARVIEVELNDASAQSLDWAALAQAAGQTAGPTGTTRPAISGLRVADVSRFTSALAAQGTVTVLASPRILVLNNEPAVVRGASTVADADDNNPPRGPDVTLGVTPHVASDGVVMLSLTPIVTVYPADQDDRAAITAFREADTLARVADGETIVVAGFTRARELRERRVGLRGGWFGRSTVVTTRRVELLILLTPRIL